MAQKMTHSEAGEGRAGSRASKRWYVLRTYVGYEARARTALQDRIRRSHVEEKFGEILVPTEERTSRRGAPRTTHAIATPGYLFIEMEMTPESRAVVTGTPRILGFIGGAHPQTLAPAQVEEVRRAMTEGVVRPRAPLRWGPGDSVRVREGPFANLTGAVEAVDPAKQKVRVVISIFGRPTPVELDASSVEKLEV